MPSKHLQGPHETAQVTPTELQEGQMSSRCAKLPPKCLQIAWKMSSNWLWLRQKLRGARARCILLVRVRACVLACGVCVRACVFGCMCACARACMRACGFCVLACVRVASASCSCAFVCHLASARRASLRAFVRACEWRVCVHARTQACVCACARACACVRHRRLSRSRQLTKTTGRLCGPDLLPTEEDLSLIHISEPTRPY